MTDLQIIAALCGGGLTALTGSQFFIYYKIGRMEQRLIDTINGHLDNPGKKKRKSKKAKD